MRIAIPLICLIILSACTFPLASSESVQRDRAVSELFLQGVYDLSEKNSYATLQKLIRKYPDSSQASTAKKLLKRVPSANSQDKSPEKNAIDQLRQENQRLRQDLEKLRQLLIKSEKRAS